MKATKKKAQATKRSANGAGTVVTGTAPRIPRRVAKRFALSAAQRKADPPLTLEDARKLSFPEVLENVAMLTALYKQEATEVHDLIFFDQWRDAKGGAIANARQLRSGVAALEDALRRFVETVRRRRQQLDRIVK